MFRVKFLAEGAKAPTCSNPGFDLGYDLYALEDTTLVAGVTTKVSTGVAIELAIDAMTQLGKLPIPCGCLLRDRSSMASKGIKLSGGVIDAGYRGEVSVLLTLDFTKDTYEIKAGDKIAQLIPTTPLTRYTFEVVEELSDSSRGTDGFGSTGR